MKKATTNSSLTEATPTTPVVQASSSRRVRKPSPIVASVLAVAEAAPAPEAVPPQVQPSSTPTPVAAAAGKKKKKPKVVRDSFTMPESDYAKIAELKKKGLEAGVSIKKSELLRAGLHALEALPIAQLKALLSDVENVKTGRPASEKNSETA